jgi:CBS domain-containing protein
MPSHQPVGQPQGTQPTGRQQIPQSTGQQPQPRGQIQSITRERLRPVTVETIVETDVVTARIDEPITSVVGKMAQNHVGCIVVLDGDGQPTGILTDRKIALALEDDSDVAERHAGDVISGNLTTATVDATITDVIERMNDATIRRLPIVDDAGNLQGIVTLDDVLVLLGNQLDSALDVVAAQTSRH